MGTTAGGGGREREITLEKVPDPDSLVPPKDKGASPKAQLSTSWIMDGVTSKRVVLNDGATSLGLSQSVLRLQLKTWLFNTFHIVFVLLVF